MERDCRCPPARLFPTRLLLEAAFPVRDKNPNLRPGDVECRPPCQCLGLHGMNSRDMIDQFSHFLWDVALLLPQPQQILSQTYFVAIDFILMEPDATLWLLCVVVLEIEAEGFVACAGGTHEKWTLGNCQHRSVVRERGNGFDRPNRRCRCSTQDQYTHECSHEYIAESMKRSRKSLGVSSDVAAVLHDDRTP